MLSAIADRTDSDLAISHGIAPSLRAEDPDVVQLIMRVRDACLRHHVIPAIFTSGQEAAVRWQQEGFRLLTVGSDRLLMTEAATRLMSAIRAEVDAPARP